MKNLFLLSLLALSTFVFISCGDDEATLDLIITSPPGGEFTQDEILDQTIIINSSGFAPLTAQIQLETNIPTRVVLRVVGRKGNLSDVVKDFDSLSTKHNIPVLGLYGGFSNTVEITLFDASGLDLGP